MKNQLNFRYIFLALLSVFVLTAGFQNVYAQKAKKNKVRLKAQYIKIMDGESFIDIKATSKIKKQNITVSGIDVIVFNELEDDRIKLGTVTTNMKGEGRFVFKNFNSIQADSSNTYTIYLSFKGNETFKKAKKSISFMNADIIAKMVIKDSVNYISARLSDPVTDTPLEGESLTIQVQRLFGPLILGDEFNDIDDDGTIFVPVEEGIPGVDGILTFEVVLNDSDDYGTVKALIEAPIGTAIIDESTFDKRTMWSPRNKTPLFLLIFPNLLIIGIWGLIVYLIINLFKISKTKN